MFRLKSRVIPLTLGILMLGIPLAATLTGCGGSSGGPVTPAPVSQPATGDEPSGPEPTLGEEGP